MNLFHIIIAGLCDSTNLGLVSRGVAARALHLSRGVEKPSGRVTYIVVLEGLCRFSVQELSARGTYYVARINRLDLTKAGMVIYHSVTKFYSHHKSPSHTYLENFLLCLYGIIVSINWTFGQGSYELVVGGCKIYVIYVHNRLQYACCIMFLTNIMKVGTFYCVALLMLNSPWRVWYWT